MKKTKRDWPRTVTSGSVAVKVYRVKAPSNKTGFGYVVAWHTPSGRRTQPFADGDKAIEEARIKAAQLAVGQVEAAGMTSGDRSELVAARKIVGARPLLSVLEEWQKAYEMTGGRVLDAATAWSQKPATKFKRALASDVVEDFIKYKTSKGRKGERTYGSKLRPISDHFKGQYLDEILALEWSAYLNQWTDGVSQNDHRKRTVEMCKWARDLAGHLPRGIKTEIEYTERAQEDPTEIGILTPAVYHSALHWIHDNHPEHLAALVIAGLCGVRSDEIHGKRDDRDPTTSKRQTWEDINLPQKHLNVTIAKKNTPAWRLVPLGDSAIAWLAKCPGDHTGPICLPGAMEKIRWLLLRENYVLPGNCFRHSYITYQIAVVGDKAKVANWAGNSVTEIDKRYRRPELPTTGAAWFSSDPNKN